jgi:hypothetical protein
LTILPVVFFQTHPIVFQLSQEALMLPLTIHQDRGRYGNQGQESKVSLPHVPEMVPTGCTSWIATENMYQDGVLKGVACPEVIDGRYCKGSTTIITNIDFKQLGDYLCDPAMTTATVDRMIHHSIIINRHKPFLALPRITPTPTPSNIETHLHCKPQG